jgi:hypothetical protein
VNRAVVQRLRAELAIDLAAFEGRGRELEQVHPEPSDAGACALAAVTLHHAAGSIESAPARISRHVEGEAPAGGHWHQELLEAAALDIPGIRPALLSRESLVALRQLLGFRQVFRHADAVTLDAGRLEALRSKLLRAVPGVLEDFVAADRWLAGVAAGLEPWLPYRACPPSWA